MTASITGKAKTDDAAFSSANKPAMAPTLEVVQNPGIPAQPYTPANSGYNPVSPFTDHADGRAVGYTTEIVIRGEAPELQPASVIERRISGKAFRILFDNSSTFIYGIFFDDNPNPHIFRGGDGNNGTEQSAFIGGISFQKVRIERYLDLVSAMSRTLMNPDELWRFVFTVFESPVFWQEQ